MNAVRTAAFLASLAIVVGMLAWARAVLVPLALAVLLAFILNPVVVHLQRRGLRRAPAVLAVTLLTFLLVAGVGSALTLQISELGQQLPQYQDNIAEKIAALRQAGKGTAFERLQGVVKHVERRLKIQSDGQRPPPEPVPVRLETSGMSEFGKFAGPLAETLAAAGLVIALVIFMLIYRADLRARLVRLVGYGRLVVTTRAIDDTAERISRFLLAQLAVNAGFGLALSLGLLLIGVPYALLWGFLAAVLRFIPFLGTWVSALLVVAFSVAAFPGWTQPLLVLALFAGLDVLTYQAIEPLVFGRSTGITPVALLVAAAVWTWLWGPIGLALSTPLTTCLVVLGRYVPQLEFLDILLGDPRAADPQIGFYQRLLARDLDEALDLVADYLQDHAPESLCDEVLIPALALARRDRAAGALDADDQLFILQATRGVLDDVFPAGPEDASGDAAATGAGPSGPRALVLGCPARDETDELALEMFRRMSMAAGCGFEVQVVSAKALAAEVAARVRDERPALAVVAAVPPGGLAQARYLCKRLRAESPEQRILVGRWGGEAADMETVGQRLRAVGVDAVAATLAESREHAAPLARLAARACAATPSPEPV